MTELILTFYFFFGGIGLNFIGRFDRFSEEFTNYIWWTKHIWCDGDGFTYNVDQHIVLWIVIILTEPSLITYELSIEHRA